MVLFGLLWIAVTTLPVQVTPTNGEVYEANLVGFNADGIKLDFGGKPQIVPLTEVRRLERTDPADITKPTMSAGLRGGARLRIEGLRIVKETATLLMRRQESLEVPLEQLDWVRFRTENAAIDPDWLGIVGQRQVDDILVIRRSATAIDQAPGIVLGADESKVDFDLGGSAVPAPIAKLEGIVFANRSPEEPKGTSVTDIMGSQWSVKSFEPGPDETSLTMVLSSGVRRQLKLEQIQSIRVSDGSTLLASLQPVTSDYQPLVELPVDRSLLTNWLGVQSDNNRDLILRSRSSVTYRIDTDATKFVALVMPDRSVEAGSGTIVRIKFGDEVAWEQAILPGDSAKGIELEVGTSSRITIEVDYGSGPTRGDAGDVVRFIEPRFLK